MCLKTFGRFRANIEVVSASRIKVYEYIKCRRRMCLIFSFLSSSEFIIAKKKAQHRFALFTRKVDIFFA